MLEEEEEEDGNVDVSRRRNLDRVEDGDVAMTAVVLTGQSGRRHRLNTGKKWECLIKVSEIRFKNKSKKNMLRFHRLINASTSQSARGVFVAWFTLFTWSIIPVNNFNAVNVNFPNHGPSCIINFFILILPSTGKVSGKDVLEETKGGKSV